MKLLDQYNEIQQKIYDYFGFKEGWHVYPITDSKAMFWCIKDDMIYKWSSMDSYNNLDEDDFYNDEIITHSQNKGVYKGKEFTAVLVDTNVDGNKFLDIYDNSKMVEWKDEIGEL